MTHYSPIDSGETRGDDQNEWVDLRDHSYRISGEGASSSTAQKHLGDAATSPEWPLGPSSPVPGYDRVHLEKDIPHTTPVDPKVQHRNASAKSASFFERLRDGWLWEVLGLVTCILSFGAIVGFISAYSEKEVPQFGYGITLNGIISVLGTIAKASMLLAVSAAISQFKWLGYRNSGKAHSLRDLQMYDSASRGPWGALEMLLYSRGRYLGSLGALVVVAAFGFDPFLQTLVVYPQRITYKNSTESALVRRSDIFNDTSESPYEQTNGLNIGDYGMTNAFSRGVFDGNLAPRMTQTVCASGNCTFPTFSSLGVCSHCENVTEYAQKHYACTTSDKGEMEQINCTINLPGAPPYPAFSTIYEESTATQDHPYMIVYPANLIYYPESLWYDYMYNGTYAGVESPLMPIATVKVDPSDQQTITRADLCAFSVCVKTYNESVKNGNISSTILSTYLGRLQGNSVDINISPPADKEGSITSPIFAVDGLTAMKIGGTIGAKLFGNITASINALGNIGYTPTSDIIEALDQTSDLYGLMDSIATAMTNHIRSLSSVTVSGQVGTVETYVHVRWIWLTLPGALIILSATFLALAMFETRRKDAEVWKDSSLALIFHGLETSGKSLTVVKKLSQMEDRAKEIKVKLERMDNEDWRLFRAN